MTTVLLGIAVPIAALGLIAVVWAARGGPRWVRGIAKVTMAFAEVVASMARSNRRSSGDSSSTGGGDGGSGG
ncbi:hypothetical protein [Streptomyces sp. NPDC058308]|uniref:hypothetical protein n=1 Tax=Streptomyces sp. NPDC058308 TaxID=3346440 RepID=UPI0036EE3C75